MRLEAPPTHPGASRRMSRAGWKAVRHAYFEPEEEGGVVLKARLTERFGLDRPGIAAPMAIAEGDPEGATTLGGEATGLIGAVKPAGRIARRRAV